MTPVVLGLDVGGANLKAATADRRAASVPFPLWKEPDRLPAVLAELVARFPDAAELAVTMTGELCDCYETKRQGVSAILDAVLAASRSRPVRVWTTDGRFVGVEEARREYLRAAAANWHALATFAGGYVPRGTALLVDIGSTTTDLIPILDGSPWTEGKTDPDRLTARELVYTGVKRTPVCALMEPGEGCAEFFASVGDVYLRLGHVPDRPDDTDTADGRPATAANAHARLARMLGGDGETIPMEETAYLAERLFDRQTKILDAAIRHQLGRLRSMRWESLGEDRGIIVSGSGEFLARRLIQPYLRGFTDVRSLSEQFGDEIASAAPAYAVAVLAAERRP